MKFAKNMTLDHQNTTMKSQNLKGDGTYLQEMNENAKMQAKEHKWRLGAARNESSHKLLVVLNVGCRNLHFGERVTRGSWVHLPREEGTRSRHQRLFEENVGKTGKVQSTNFNRERFGSCFYTRRRYQHPTSPSQGTAAFNQVCKYDFKIMYFSLFYVFLLFMGLFVIFFIFCGR